MTATTSIILSTSNQYQTVLDNYSSILEKTNSQLGLWLSIGNYMVAILGLIIAIIAIGVAWVLWKNSKEQKDQFKAFLTSQEKVIEENIKRSDEVIKKGRQEAEAKLEVLIVEQQMKMSSATTDSKKEIQKAIDDLKKEKATIGANISVPVYSPAGNIGFKIYSCSACGYRSNFYSKFCPMCGNQGS